MKKTILLLILIPVMLEAYSQKTRLGVCLNPHFDWFAENSSLLKSSGMNLGIEGGLVIENYFTKNYALNTGIRLGTYGAKLVYNDSIVLQTDDSEELIRRSTEVNYKLQYITIPVGLKLKTNQIGFLTYYALIGFTPQINISAKADAGHLLDNAGVSKEVGLFNLAYHFGAGIEYGIGGSTSIVAGLVYNNGFIDVLTKQRARETLNTLTIQLGVMF